MSPQADHSPIPPSYLEQKRKEAQAQYREEQAYIATNKANFDKLLKEEQEALEKQMPSTFWGAMTSFMGPPPQPPQPGQPQGEPKPAGSA